MGERIYKSSSKIKAAAMRLAVEVENPFAETTSTGAMDYTTFQTAFH